MCNKKEVFSIKEISNNLVKCKSSYLFVDNLFICMFPLINYFCNPSNCSEIIEIYECCKSINLVVYTRSCSATFADALEIVLALIIYIVQGDGEEISSLQSY